MNQSWVTPASPLKTRMTGYPRRTVRFGPGVVRALALRPQPRPASPYSRIVGGLPSAAETGGEPTMRRAIRRTATTAAALTGDNMEGRNHRIMLQAAELGAVNLVVADLERGEPVDVLVARDHIDLEIECRDVEGVGDVDAVEDQLDGAAHFDGEVPGREAQLRGRDGRTGAVGRDEPPGPLLGKHAHREVGIRRDGVRDDERLEGGDSEDDQDDRGNDRPRGLELPVMGLRDGRSRRVPGPHAELQDGVGDQHHDEDADADRWDQHQVEELLRRALSRRNRRLGPRVRRRGREDRQEGRGQEERAPGARHRPAESRGPLKHLWYYANSPCERRSNAIDWKAFCRLAKYGESRPSPGPGLRSCMAGEVVSGYHSRTEPIGISRWLTTTNHHDIGILYLANSFLFFLIGGVLALLMRSELAYPGRTIVDASTYMELFTMHGTTMIFLVSIHILVTIFRHRAAGITFNNLSLFVWSILVTQGLVLLATPVLAGGLFILLLDRHGMTAFLSPIVGGDPIMWQHLFWFYSHPAVYIMILPAMGIISEVIPRMSHKPIFGYKAIALSTVAIGFLSFGVWVHHMFTTGLSISARLPFMIITLAIAVPSGIKIFNWIATMWGGAIELKAPMLFAIGFVTMFVIGGINGVFQAPIPLDYPLQDTYWVVAHLHYVLFGGTILGAFAGFYFWFPRMSKRMYSERIARWHFGFTIVGFNVVFFTMHFLGLLGMPRRIYDYSSFGQLSLFWTLNWLASIGAFILGAGQLFFVANIVWTFVKGPVSDPDPWGEIPAQVHEPRVPGVPVYAMPIHAMANGGVPEGPSEPGQSPRAP